MFILSFPRITENRDDGHRAFSCVFSGTPDFAVHAKADTAESLQAKRLCLLTAMQRLGPDRSPNCQSNVLVLRCAWCLNVCIAQRGSTRFEKGEDAQPIDDCSQPMLEGTSVSSVVYDLSALSADLQQHRDAARESGISAPLAALHISGSPHGYGIPAGPAGPAVAEEQGFEELLGRVDAAEAATAEALKALAAFAAEASNHLATAADDPDDPTVN
eukprot:Skav228659  [mRNA]  locus=scaffold2369:266920:270081:+ [translate_table: standard]